MSRARGAVPILLATGFGVANGIAIFGPSFKEQQQEREEQERKSKEMARLSEMEGVESLAVVEAAASRAITTEKALQAAPVQTSWWPKMSLWSSAAAPTSQAIPPIAEPKEKVERNSRAYNPGETRPKPDHN